MKKHLIDFPENNISIEGFYDRLRPCYDSIMQFGDRVLVAQMNWNGMLEGAVYGFVEDSEEGWSPIECRTLKKGRAPSGAFARSGGFFQCGNTHKSDKKRCA